MAGTGAMLLLGLSLQRRHPADPAPPVVLRAPRRQSILAEDALAPRTGLRATPPSWRVAPDPAAASVPGGSSARPSPALRAVDERPSMASGGSAAAHRLRLGAALGVATAFHAGLLAVVVLLELRGAVPIEPASQDTVFSLTFVSPAPQAADEPAPASPEAPAASPPTVERQPSATAELPDLSPPVPEPPPAPDVLPVPDVPPLSEAPPAPELPPVEAPTAAALPLPAEPPAAAAPLPDPAPPAVAPPVLAPPPPEPVAAIPEAEPPPVPFAKPKPPGIAAAARRASPAPPHRFEAAAPATATSPADARPASPSGTDAAAAAAPAPAQPAVTAMLPVVAPRPVAGLAANRTPDYPLEARRRGWQGQVMLRVDVSASGEPTDVSVAAGSGHDVLDRAAVSAVRAWRFQPATRGGVPVAAVADVPIHFRLDD